jgi:hypothetical protein
MPLWPVWLVGHLIGSPGAVRDSDVGCAVQVAWRVVPMTLKTRRWLARASFALMLASAGTAKTALGTGGPEAALATSPAIPPRHPFLIMNPRSGGGKVIKFQLKERAEALGAEVALLEGPGTVDVAALARKAVADGADLLGVAGGDGTQALVADIAAEHDLPSWSSAPTPATTSRWTWA